MHASPKQRTLMGKQFDQSHIFTDSFPISFPFLLANEHIININRGKVELLFNPTARVGGDPFYEGYIQKIQHSS